MTEPTALPTTPNKKSPNQSGEMAPDGGAKTRPIVPQRRSCVLALCQFPEPDLATATEIAAVAQAIHHKIGGTCNINKKHIKTLVSKLRHQFKDHKLTQERVKQIAANLYGEKAVRGDYSSFTNPRKGPQPSKQKAKAPPAEKNNHKEPETVRVDNLMEAATFVRNVGRQDALKVLETYLVLTQPQS